MPMRTERRNPVSGSAVLVHGALALMAALVFVVPARASAQSSASLRESLERELAQPESKAAKLDQTIAETQSEAKTLERQVKLFESEIKRRELEIRRLALAIRQAEIDIQLKVASVEELAARIGKNRTILARNVARLYEYDQENMLVVLAKNETLSDFFTALDNIRSLQAQVGELVDELRDTRTEFGKQKDDLEDFRAQQL